MSVRAPSSTALAQPISQPPAAGAAVAPAGLVSLSIAATLVAAVLCETVPASRGWLLVLSGLVAGAAGVGYGRRARAADRRAWTLLGTGQLLNGLGNVAILIDSRGWFAHGDDASAIVFTLATLTTASGFVQLVLPDGTSRWTAGIDALLVLASTVAVGWYYGAQRVVSSDTRTLPSLTGLIGADLDLLMLSVGLLIWWVRPSGQRWAPRLAVLAQLSATLGDLGVLQRFLPVPSGDLELTWLLSSCLFGIGALVVPRRGASPIRLVPRGRALALVTLVVAASIVAVLADAGRRLDVISVAGWTLVVLLLLVREGHAVRRAHHLARDLARSEGSRRDITEQMRLAALRDPLTGLPNRSHLEQLLAIRFADGAPVGVVIVVIDELAQLRSDPATESDEGVVAAARRIAEAVRPGDLVARIEAGEFAIALVPGTTPAEAIRLATRVLDHLRPSRAGAGLDLPAGARAGVAVGGAVSPAESLRNASLALSAAKTGPRPEVSVFEPAMYEEYARRVELERRFRRAYDCGELSLAYQPIVDIATGEIVAAEALLRWRDRTGVVAGAEEFVPLAEDVGSIVAIGAWVLREATAQAARWTVAGRPIAVSVNVSAHQVQSAGLLLEVDRALRESGLAPDRLCLEITESVLLADDEAAIRVLRRLSARGVRLAIDDFGTGYSGLTYLLRLPVDQIKIDQSFLAGASAPAGDDDGRALLAGVVALGRDLGLVVTVEGVETDGQVELLRELGVERGQGFHLGRPLRADALRRRLARPVGRSVHRPLGPDGETPTATG